jgi:hypothetical protein
MCLPPYVTFSVQELRARKILEHARRIFGIGCALLELGFEILLKLGTGSYLSLLVKSRKGVHLAEDKSRRTLR